jgi:hypothetical protein
MTPRDLDAENVVHYLTRTSPIAQQLDCLINEKLWAIEGYEDLPRDLRNRIEETATALYCAGYLHAVQRRE